jgi:hypothetical protein
MSLHIRPECLSSYISYVLLRKVGWTWTHAVQHAISQAIFSDMNEMRIEINNAISAKDIKRIKHIRCVIRRSDNCISLMILLHNPEDCGLAMRLLLPWAIGYGWVCVWYRSERSGTGGLGLF